MKNKLDLELKVLKHLLISDKAINRVISLNITKEHFTFKEEGATILYPQQLFKLIMGYFEESGGSLVTRSVLESRLIKSQTDDIHKEKFMIMWEKILVQDYDENDLYDLLIQLKQNLSLQFWNDMYQSGHQTILKKGIEKATEVIQEKLDKVKEELFITESDRQNINLFEDGIGFFKEEYEKRKRNFNDFKGIGCGLSKIDSKTFGFMPGQVITLLAPSSGGKSIQLLNWADYAFSHEHKNVLYFSFELDLWFCMLRHLSLKFEIPYFQLKSIDCDDDQITDIISGMKVAQEHGNYIEYEVNMEDPTPEFIDARIRELTNTRGKPDLVIVDYIGNMTTRETRRDAKPWERQGDAFEKIFMLTKKHQVSTLTAQQINRESIRENRKMKEAGKPNAFYQDAISGDSRVIHLSHYVIGMDPDKETNMATYYPVKMRDAIFEPFSARVDPSCNKILELTETEEQEYRRNKQNGVVNTKDNPPKTVSLENGQTKVDWGAGSNIYGTEDLEVTIADDWVIEEE
jgi:hypothetical protein